MAFCKLPLLNKGNSRGQLLDLVGDGAGAGNADRLKLALAEVGPPVDSIETTSNMRFLKIRYSDSSFVMIDRTVLQPEEAILGHQFGHH
jgi:hypothetical protein